jgi:host factor-I protein
MPATRKSAAATETGHEALYLKSLAERQVRVEIKLRDGERLHGWIEYFDDNMLRLTREDGPNLFVYKHHIHTISEGSKSRTNGAINNGAVKPA